jgi:hypothetical protein
MNTMFCQVKFYYDRRSVGQSVWVSGTHLGSATNFFKLLLGSYGFSDVGAPSLTRSRACSFQGFFFAPSFETPNWVRLF